jgi:hypothetical protein
MTGLRQILVPTKLQTDIPSSALVARLRLCDRGVIGCRPTDHEIDFGPDSRRIFRNSRTLPSAAACTLVAASIKNFTAIAAETSVFRLHS